MEGLNKIINEKASEFVSISKKILEMEEQVKKEIYDYVQNKQGIIIGEDYIMTSYDREKVKVKIFNIRVEVYVDTRKLGFLIEEGDESKIDSERMIYVSFGIQEYLKSGKLSKKTGSAMYPYHVFSPVKK